MALVTLTRTNKRGHSALLTAAVLLGSLDPCHEPRELLLVGFGITP